jgi:hypothetical protein
MEGPIMLNADVMNGKSLFPDAFSLQLLSAVDAARIRDCSKPGVLIPVLEEDQRTLSCQRQSNLNINVIGKRILKYTAWNGVIFPSFPGGCCA